MTANANVNNNTNPSQEDRIEELTDIVLLCMGQFSYCAGQHEAKNTPEDTKLALLNRRFEQTCRKALTREKSSLSTS